METSIEHLTLHYQASNVKLPSRQQLCKLQQLKEEKGELSLDEERKLHQLKRAAEAEVLREADVICCTCIGAGDKRLRGMRFEQVSSCDYVANTIPGNPESYVTSICNRIDSR